MEQLTTKIKMLWTLYIIDLDNRGVKTKFYGQDKAYYTGISTDVGRRIGDYLFKRGRKGWVLRFWKNARIIPVYIEYIEGNKKEAIRRERQIKRKSRKLKERLIRSEQNQLVGYKPLKYLVLKNYNGNGETIANIY